MAFFIIMILLFSTFDNTNECLPKPDIIEKKTSVNMGLAEAVNSVEMSRTRRM
ncbi:Uncharacterized protein BM_BM18568 [Brugia malayi]|uniref:Uncharacterized protein n=1 Tax=Brugia malayi TaxID=6279 RepID=A0A4E9F3P7_BRUMA|nr:Uncharacterized protein BM_BM18568 [Brugia malayi]VIO89818.1 Uncharacterized protein BM_BM18568 [Brugia malayi]